MLVKEFIEKLQEHDENAEVLLEETPSENEIRRIPFDLNFESDTNNATGTPMVILHRADNTPIRTNAVA